MFKHSLLFLLVFTGNYVIGQNWLVELPASASPWSKFFSTAAASQVNPAILALPLPAEVLLYTKKPYAIPGLAETRLFGRFKSGQNAGFAAGFGRFGNPDYSSLDFFLAYGMRLNKKFSLGISGQFVHSRIKGFHGVSIFVPGLSIQWAPKFFIAGIFFRHAAVSSSLAEPITWISGMGIGKDLSEQLYLDAAVIMNSRMITNLQVSFQYKMLESWRLVIRCQTMPFRYAFETGYLRNRFALRLTGDWHPHIGLTPGLLLVYTITNQ